MVDFKKLLEEEEQKDKLNKIYKEKIDMATKKSKSNTVGTDKVKTPIRNFVRKAKEGKSKYDFEGAVNIKEFIDQDFILVSGFVKVSDKYQIEQGTFIIETNDEKQHTVKTTSSVLMKQFKEEDKQGLPVRVHLLEIQSQESDNTYLTFVPQ